MSAWWNEKVTDNTANPFGIEGYSAHSYGDAFADVYDQWYQDLDDHDFIVMISDSLGPKPARILELGVGTGRLVRVLQSLRPDIADEIVGIDSSAAMLEIARGNCDASVVLMQGDFSTTLPDGPFDVIFVGYNTLFNLPDEHALRSCMTLVSSRLGPEGKFFVDVVLPPQTSTQDHMGIRSMSTTEVVVSVSRHDAESQHITGQFIQFTDGSPVRLRPWSIRYFSPTQLDTHARNAGLEMTQRVSDGHDHSFDPTADRHISCFSLAPPK
jgi:SAM-dependent methyltransferase